MPAPDPKFKIGQVWTTRGDGSRVTITKLYGNGKKPISVLRPNGSYHRLNAEGQDPVCPDRDLATLLEDPKFAVGQKWKTRDGATATITGEDRDDPRCHHWYISMSGGRADCVNPDGRADVFNPENPHDNDLIELVTDANYQEVPTLAAGQVWQTRGGQTVTAERVEDYYRMRLPDGGQICWWYKDHQKSKAEHAPGTWGASHEDALVKLVAVSATKPKPDAKPESKFAIGQTWKTRDDRTVKIVKHDPDPSSKYNWYWEEVGDSSSDWVTNEGRSDGTEEDDNDLVEQVTESGVPALAVGQVWKTRGGKTVEIIKGDGGPFACKGTHVCWWYASHSTTKEYHSPGSPGSFEHEDDLVELVTEAKQETPFVIIGLSEIEARVLAFVLDQIGGQPDANKPRSVTDAIRAVLPFQCSNVQMARDICRPGQTNIYFKEDSTIDKFPLVDRRA